MIGGGGKEGQAVRTCSSSQNLTPENPKAFSTSIQNMAAALAKMQQTKTTKVTETELVSFS